MVKSHAKPTKKQQPELQASSRHRTHKRSSQPRRFTIQQTDKPAVEIQVDGNNYHAYSQDAIGESSKYLLTLGVQYRDDEPDSGSETEEEPVSSSRRSVDSNVVNIFKHMPKKDIKTIKSLAPYFIIPAVKLAAFGDTEDSNGKKKKGTGVHVYTRRVYVMSVAPTKAGLPEQLASEPKDKQVERKFSSEHCSRIGGSGTRFFPPVTRTNCVRAWLETERTPGKPAKSQSHGKHATKQLYHISGLLTGLQADSVCYGLSGGAHVRIMEDYFINNTRGYLIGTLYDGASNKVPKHCGLMNKLVGLKHIPSSLLESLSMDLSNYASLSAMTVVETGFTFYEKFGYMAGVLTPALERLTRTKGLRGLEASDLTLNHMTYMDTYNAWLDQIYTRLCILYTPIGKLKTMIADIKPDGTKKEIFGLQPETLKNAITACEKAYRLRQSINTKTIPGKLANMSLYDIYQKCKILTDLRSEDAVAQVVNGKHNPGTNLFYILAAHKIINSNLTGILMYDSDVFDMPEIVRECVKFTRVWDTPANNFTLELHRQLPGVKADYLAEQFTLPVPPDGESHGKTSKKLTAKAELALQESMRKKQDKIIQALKTRTVTESPTTTPDL